MNKIFKNHKLSPFALVVIYLLILFLGCSLIYGTFTYSYLKKVPRIDREITKKTDTTKDNNIEYIAILGTQRKEDSYFIYPEPTPDLNRGFAKAIMILAYDKNTNDIRLLSLQKDISNTLGDYGVDRIEKAYQVGTSSLMLDTINNTLNLNVDKFLVFNLDVLIYMVNALKLIDVEVEPNEVALVNEEIAKCKETHSNLAFELTYPGFQKLNGLQSQIYLGLQTDPRGSVQSEINYNLRANKITKGIIKAIKDSKLSSLPFSLSYMYEYMFTNLSPIELANFALTLHKSNGIAYASVPIEKSVSDVKSLGEGRWYVPYNKERTTKDAHEFLVDGKQPYSPKQKK